MSKDTLAEMQRCLQHSQAKIEFLQLESQLQQDELQHKRHNSELVQNIETKSDQQQVNNVEVDLDHVPNEGVDLQKEAEIWHTLPKPIIRPWEALVHNKDKTSVGYDKDVSFHILVYLKPIQFHSVGFLHDNSPLAVPDSAPHSQRKVGKWQHCDRVGHMKDQCFDLHPCEHCHKTTHSSNKCFRNKPLLQEQRFILDGSLIGNGFQQPRRDCSHVSISSRVLNSLAVEFSPSSHLVSDRGE